METMAFLEPKFSPFILKRVEILMEKLKDFPWISLFKWSIELSVEVL